MDIAGYDDDPLVAAEELPGRPGFWAAHLLWLCDGDDRVTAEWFGTTAAEAEAVEEELLDEDRWPVIRIPFGGGHSALVTNRNAPDDGGTEYAVTHPAWDRLGHLATIGATQAGPGLAWRELTHIAGTPDPDAPGVHDPHARLLLLLPALGDVDLPAAAVATTREALDAVGVPARHGQDLAVLLTGNPLWEPAFWAVPPDSPGILECDGRWSPRRGVALASGITSDQSDRLARALGATG